MRRVVEFCDGWFPRLRAGWEPKSAAARLLQAEPLRPDAIPRPCRSRYSMRRPIGRRSRPIARREFARVLLEVPDLSRDEVLRLLDKNSVEHCNEVADAPRPPIVLKP